MREIDDALTYCKSNSNFVDVIVVTKKIINNIMKKIFDCLKHLSQLFDFKKTKKLLSHRFYDHKIEFIANFKNLSKSKVYFLLVRKLETFQKKFKKNLKKNFINSSNASFASSILFVVKSNETLRLCVNYRELNQITKRNVYSISLIEKTLIKIIDCKYIFKLNIIIAFNKLRMNKNNENFTTFICSLNIYKYYVLSFELINDSTNFQHYMNDLLFEFINDFCQIYLDDTLIYNKTRKKHNKYLRLINEKFIEIELQIDIDKCEFFKQKVVFLSCIIFIFEIRINFKRLKL